MYVNMYVRQRNNSRLLFITQKASVKWNGEEELLVHQIRKWDLANARIQQTPESAISGLLTTSNKYSKAQILIHYFANEIISL
jgi:hypothetical protein